jgi:Recombinase-like helix-turn-helix domain
MDHNPHLAILPQGGDDKGSEAGIERPDRVVNIAWQTRAAPPTPAETALADALQALFAEDIDELSDIVAALNRRGVAPPDGTAAWSEAALTAVLGRLGR